MSARYLGMRAGDLDGKPFAKFWRPTMAPLAAHAVDAIARSPIAATLLPPLERARELLDDSIAAIEDGFALEPSGALHVAIRTDFPGAAPAMIAAARGGGLAGHALAAIARRVRRPSEREGRALLIHCAEEMAHLASFLPRIHAELHDAE